MAKFSKKSITWIAIILVIVALVGYKLISSQKQKSSAPTGGGNQLPTIPVKGYVVKLRNIDNAVISTGTILANEEIVVQPEISGRITQIYFKEGSTVSQGTLLVKLYDADLQAQLKKLKLQEELAAKNEQRSKELRSIDAVSQQEYDMALNSLNTIQADIDLVQANIQKTEIRAPFSGKVGLRNVSVGAYVSPTTVITSLQQVQPVKLDFSVPEKYFAMLNAKNKVEFTVEGLDDVFSAPILAIEPSVDVNSRSIRIRAIFENRELKVLPGAFAKINLPLTEIENGIMIPTEAIIPELKGQKVFVVKDGKAFSQSVIMGFRNDSTVQILEGLKEGDTVLTTGILQVRQDSPLKITSVN